MSRVRKDILNGWKEISGYVCRDIRTVERWEKYRGLPVRRVPGAGRATVYAIISEVDEWLASTPLVGPEVPDLMTGAGTDSVAEVELSPEARVMEGVGLSPDARAAEGTPADQGTAAAEADETGRVEADPVSAGLGSPSRRNLSARSLLGVGLGGLVLLAALGAVWHGVRSPGRATIGAGTASGAASGMGRAGSANLSHHSPVAGVDALYLSGIYSYEQRTPDSLEHSRERFSAAIAQDPNFAPAYVGLANTYNLLREYSRMPEAEAYPKAKAAAERAIALDPSLPEAHASLAFVDFFWSWKPEEAEREFRTALALDTSSALAHHWYGSMLTHEGRYAEAIEQLDAAQRLQPNSAAVLSSRALAWGLDGHRDEAVQQLNGMLSEASGATSPHGMLAILSRVEPMDCEAFVRETRAVARMRNLGEVMAMTDAAEHGLRSGGRLGMWKAIMNFERGRHPQREDHNVTMVQAELALGDTETALTDLESLEARHDAALIGILMDPSFRGLHGKPRFVSLATRMGFPAELAGR